MLTWPVCLMGSFPLSWALGAESAKWPREEPSTGQSGSRRQCSHSRGRYRSRQCQSPSPQCPSQCQSPSPRPPQSHPANEQLTHSLDDLNLQLRSHKSQSRVWHDDAPTPTEEKQQRKKQVSFDMDEELGDDPTLPPGLTLFLAEGTVKEWDDTPSSSTPMPLDSPWLVPSKGPQSHPTYTGEPGWRSLPNPPLLNWDANQGQKRDWIWWTIPANGSWWRWPPSLVERDQSQLRVFLGEHIMRECHTNAEAQHYAQWQVVAFSLPFTQQEAFGWGDAPPWLSGLCPQDFMPITDASSPKDF